jgi:predicted ATPase
VKLTRLHAVFFRCLRDVTVPFRDLNVFIGANASGKSTILDALRFLNQGMLDRDFQPAVSRSRGGIVNVAWKGDPADEVTLTTTFEDQGGMFEWLVRLKKEGYDFAVVKERLTLQSGAHPPSVLLEAERGKGQWWSGTETRYVSLELPVTGCAMAAAAADAGFPGRHVAQFVRRWAFFDPNPFVLRRGWSGFDGTSLDTWGRNLAERLYTLQEERREVFNTVVDATRAILGLPTYLEVRRQGDDAPPYLVQGEPGLEFTVHQMGVSSGTLRVLALMTALFGEGEANLIGIEEPENHVHPGALKALAGYLLKARERMQILITTHSPLLLDYLNDPASVYLVRYQPTQGTTVDWEPNPEAVREALKESGFTLGEFYQTTGFGG